MAPYSVILFYFPLLTRLSNIAVPTTMQERTGHDYRQVPTKLESRHCTNTLIQDLTYFKNAGKFWKLIKVIRNMFKPVNCG